MSKNDAIKGNIGNAVCLRANSYAYEFLVQKIQKMDIKTERDVVLERVILTAQLAQIFHSGRFADGAIENILLEIGRKLEDSVSEENGFEIGKFCNKKRHILHVASYVLGIGGHTRLIHRWIMNDKRSRHSLLLISQGDGPIPPWLSEAVRSNGGDLFITPQKMSLCQKALWLRETARRCADMVVLHHGGYDVVPTIAFAVNECPPVALLNHTDHMFWLGNSVSDIVINLRSAGAELTAKRRFVLSNTVLPIPLAYPKEQVSRRDARLALGIPEDQVFLLSIGRGEKYRPYCGPYDFVATAGKILEHQSGAHLYIVGESIAGIRPYLRSTIHERLHFVGVKEDPSLYRVAADVYLESFPFGSQTALLEAALSGLPVVPAYAPLSPLLVANDDAIRDILTNPVNEQEYVERVEKLISSPEQRALLGKELRNRLLIDHVGEGWLNRLNTVYQKIDDIRHDPRPIPVSQCNITNEDIGLSLRQLVGSNHSRVFSGDDDPSVLLHTAFLAIYVGDYAKASRFVKRLDVRSSFRIILIALRIKTAMFVQRHHFLHRIYRLFRQCRLFRRLHLWVEI